MEALVFLIIPLIIYISIKVMIWKDVDLIAVDCSTYIEGINMYNCGQYEQCIAYFNDAITKNTKSCVLFYYRGLANLACNNVHSAIYNFEKATNLSHDLPDVFYQKAKALYEIADFEYALIELNKVSRMYRDANLEVLQLRAQVYLKMGNKINYLIDIKKIEQLTNITKK